MIRELVLKSKLSFRVQFNAILWTDSSGRRAKPKGTVVKAYTADRPMRTKERKANHYGTEVRFGRFGVTTHGVVTGGK